MFILSDTGVNTWTVIGIGAAIVGAMMLSFLVCKNIRAARWFFMLIGATSFLFFAILAMIQFVRYNNEWKEAFIDSGYGVWSEHWTYTDYKKYFHLALFCSAVMVFLYIFADIAFEPRYVETITKCHLEYEDSWFIPTQVVVDSEKTKVHTYFIVVLAIGIVGGGLLVEAPSWFCLFAETYDYYFIYYTIEIVIASLTFIILVLLFIRAIRYTREED